MAIKTFSIGGVHPADNKLSAGKPIEILPVPQVAYFPLSQHLGAPSEPVVQKGDEVKAGQLIAQATGFISANIHSSVSGKVEKISEILDVSGYRKKAIVIKTKGDEWEPSIDRSPDLIKETELSPEEIIKRIANAGIVGLGGASFPTHVKLSPPENKKCEILIINGVECEPYLTSDHRLMLEKSEEILVGTTLMMKALKVEKTIIGIENNKKDAIEKLESLVSSYKGISVQPLQVRYPQGGEKQLIDACVKRQVPSGKLPLEVGANVQNAGTAFAVYEAVMKNKPLIERVVTVTGVSVKNPVNLLVRVGTPVSELIEAAGGMPGDTSKIVSGGPMMGKALTSAEIPIIKGCSGILLLPEKLTGRKEVHNCIRCAKCVAACPMGLSSYLLTSLVQKKMWERAEQEGIMDCIECGVCSYVCPSSRPLLDYERLGKSIVAENIRARTKMK